MESRRQKKVSGEIQKTISDVFQRHGVSYYGKAFVTITGVAITPDLSVARIYLSVYNVENKQDIILAINRHLHDINKRVHQKIRNTLRKMPELEFFIDDSLDQAMRINQIFKDIDSGDKPDEE